ncbi:carbohydrate kinase [Erysipelothrix urinaevulpis]|uniref:carbohydrate kinase family protein n=1 Tax=Erysipelothrix urinaevulpis TaxID=2683717 RepID=UPI00135B6EF7|nr:carbohydrate kinase [Erysipelothrix urinaevulpis]
MKNIYTIGEVLIDMMQTNNYYSSMFGGASGNVAVNVARFGSESYFLGNFGQDFFGEQLKERMIKENVHLTYSSQKGKTSLAFVSWDKVGERNFQFYSESDQDYCLPASVLVDASDIVHFGSATAFMKGELEQSYLKLFRQAQENGAFISFDPNCRQELIHDLDVFKRHCLEFMKGSRLIKLSIEEFELLFGSQDYHLLTDCFEMSDNQIIVVTLGEKGSYVYYQGVAKLIPTIKIHQVDSTGAGDAFVAGMLSQLIHNLDPNLYEVIDMVTKANRVGALTASQYGAIVDGLSLE